MSSKAKKIQTHIETTHPMSKDARKVAEDIASNLITIGNCSCGNALMIALGDEHPFNYYCLNCNAIGDVRIPNKNHKFLRVGVEENKVLNSPLELLKHAYKSMQNKDITDEMIKKTAIDNDRNC